MSLDIAPERRFARHLRKVREANILILTDADRADERLAALCKRRLEEEGRRDIIRRSRAGRAR